jgi:hypothetical protein
MSTAVIIGIIAVGLFALVAIAATMQSIEKNKKHQRLRENGLNTRARNFHYMLEGFPEGFLSRDLQVLVCKSLLEVYQQLSSLAPETKNYSDRHQLIQQQLDLIAAKPASTGGLTLNDSGQIPDIQKLLTSLHKYITQLMANKRINNAEAHTYSAQINRLMLQTTIDGLTLASSAARNEGKIKLALYHQQTILEKLEKENADGSYNQRLSQTQALINELQGTVDTSEAETQQRRTKADAEWDELNKPDESWKKKSLYD